MDIRFARPFDHRRQRALWIRTGVLVAVYLAIHLAIILAVSLQPSDPSSPEELARAASLGIAPGLQALAEHGSPSTQTPQPTPSAQANRAVATRRPALVRIPTSALPATRAPSQAPLSGAVIAPDPSDQISRTPESKAEMDQDMLPSSATQDVAPGG
jgi:hypothetical protein